MAQATKSQNPPSRKPLTLERLKEVLHYDPETGVLKWAVDIFAGEYHTRANVRSGDVAGCRVKSGNSEYIQIRIDGRLYAAHTLAWLYMTGVLPKMVDHADLNGINNRFINLRRCTKSTNGANMRTPITNTSGFKGVTWDSARKKWAVELRHENNRYRLGRYDDLAEAAAKYLAKAKELFGEFARAA